MGPPLTSRPGAWGGGLMGGLHGTELCPHVCPHDHAARSQPCPHAPSPDQRKPHSGWSCQGSRGRPGASRASWDGNETAGALRSQPPRTQQEGAPASPRQTRSQAHSRAHAPTRQWGLAAEGAPGSSCVRGAHTPTALGDMWHTTPSTSGWESPRDSCPTWEGDPPAGAPLYLCRCVHSPVVGGQTVAAPAGDRGMWPDAGRAASYL